MTHTTRNKADVEYAVMLAVLNFQKEFMQSNYSHVQVQLLENLIEVDLTRTTSIPAEAQLAQSQEGQAQLRQMHQALFSAGQDILKKQLEEILDRTINEMVTDLEPLSGKNTIVIKLEEAIDRPP
ncbi:MAG: Na-translocating system protein MpsC family protein [Nitrospirota bacterium]|nr:Na-translocating system protein MpsC family protein [Nitrospirota bacterium]